MNKQQRQRRDAFIRERPYSSLFLAYAVFFLSNAVVSDTLSLAGVEAPNLGRYLFPFVIAFPMWRLYRREALQTLAAPETAKTTQQYSVEAERPSSFAVKKASDTFSDKF